MTNKPVTLPAIIVKSTVTPDSLFLIMPISEKLRPSNFSLSADSASTMCGGRATLSTAINAIGWLISHHNCGSMMPQLPATFPAWAIDIANDTLASIKKGSGVDTMAVCTPLVAAINRAIVAHQDAVKVKAAKASTTLRIVNKTIVDDEMPIQVSAMAQSWCNPCLDNMTVDAWQINAQQAETKRIANIEQLAQQRANLLASKESKVNAFVELAAFLGIELTAKQRKLLAA